VIAAAIAIAGARVRNPLFGAAAACFVAEYFERVADLGVVAALVIASAAALLLLREWQRPTNEWLFIATLLVLPIAGRSHADEVWTWMTIALYATFGVAMFVLALQRRHHAYFIAGALGIGIASYDYGRLLPFALELRLAIAGALLLGGSFYVARRLRDRTTGFVGTPAKLTSFDDVLESAAAMTAGAAAAKAGAVAPSEARPSGDGRFGGAGASGGY